MQVSKKNRSQHRGRPGLCWLVVLFLGTLLGTGCTREFFRDRADTDVDRLLSQKSGDDRWPLINYWIYPHPLARFADFDPPDTPSMPPDDPAAWFTAPHPQKPSKVAYTEGTGYLDLLAQFDAINRAVEAEKDKQNAETKFAMPAAMTPTRQPYYIDLDQALQLAVINSREFQTQRETLYLAALPVTTEQFNFLPQFMVTQQAIRQWTAQESDYGPTNQWELNSTAGVGMNFVTGASLLLKLANQTIIDMSGNKGPTISTSNLVFDIGQPFLRGGGLAVALEPLTQSERDLLYEVRRFARFNKEFFVQIAGGPGVGAPGLAATLVQSTFLSSGNTGTVRAAATVVGYMPTVLRKLNIELQYRNIDDLVDLLKFYREFAKGGGLSPLQVDQVEQQLLDARTQLLTQEVTYRDSIEQFKLQLGLPTDLPLELNTSVLEDLREQMFRIQKLEVDARRIGEAFTKLEPTEDGTGILRRELLSLIQAAPLTKETAFAKNFPERLARWTILNTTVVEKSSSLIGSMAVVGQLPGLNGAAAFATLAQSMTPPLLRQQMLRDSLIDSRDDLIDQEKPVPPELELKITLARRDYELGALDELLTIFKHRPWLVEKNERDRKAAQDVVFRQIEARLSLILDEAREERQQAYDKLWPQLPASKLCGRDLLRLNLDEAQDLVGQVALENRLDLMNQQALLADSWRIIAVFANSLMGTFDVRYNATMLAPPSMAIGQGFNFDGNNTRHQIIFNTELPLVRRIERNNYRASLIVYQRQRRNLQAVQDTIMLQVRSRVRRLQQLEETYKIQQRALLLLYSQVNQAREQLQAPPDPGVTRDTAAAAGTATLQLLNAQRGVPQAQTSLYTTWINYLVTRMELYRDLELMQIDSRGVWIDDNSSPPAR